ncbi:MAG: VTT domain-containing protein [candidate division WOR-3 bacterium]
MRVKQIVGAISVLIFLVIIFLVSFIFLKNFGFLVREPAVVRDVIQKYGVMAYLVYFLLYIFQIFFAPIPGQVLNIASGMLFGPLRGFLVSLFAVIIGGFLAMFVARYLGSKILALFLEENALGFKNEITRRGLPLILFLAIFPNPIGDGLFYLAGLTNIPLRILIILIAMCRIPGILIYVIAGDKIMSAGIKGWLIGGIGLLLAGVSYFLFKNKIEQLFEIYLERLKIAN